MRKEFANECGYGFANEVAKKFVLAAEIPCGSDGSLRQNSLAIAHAMAWCTQPMTSKSETWVPKCGRLSFESEILEHGCSERGRDVERRRTAEKSANSSPPKERKMSARKGEQGRKRVKKNVHFANNKV